MNHCFDLLLDNNFRIKYSNYNNLVLLCNRWKKIRWVIVLSYFQKNCDILNLPFCNFADFLFTTCCSSNFVTCFANSFIISANIKFRVQFAHKRKSYYWKKIISVANTVQLHNSTEYVLTPTLLVFESKECSSLSRSFVTFYLRIFYLVKFKLYLLIRTKTGIFPIKKFTFWL